jgi:hypothetical protein
MKTEFLGRFSLLAKSAVPFPQTTTSLKIDQPANVAPEVSALT